MIRIKRVYDPHEPDDGHRFLVDRLWPRGIKKESLSLDGWLKEMAPSTVLRNWFGHDPAKWEEFCRRYTVELEANSKAWRPLLETARTQTITLLFGAHDMECNNAVALRSFLEARLSDSPLTVDTTKPLSREEKTMQKNVWVDQDVCISCGLCVENVPDVFRFTDSGKAEVFDPAGAPEETIQAEAIDVCPVSCIHWKE
jgi:uncharacterized protein YeaO (DUF488 family)/ferredoxin